MLRYVLILLAAFLLAACSGDDDGDPSDAANGLDEPATVLAEPTPAPAEIVERASTAIEQVESFHFRLSHENGSSPMPLGLELRSAEGNIVVPDRLRAEVEARASSINIDVEVIAIGDQTWITNPFTGDWQELPGASIDDIADPTRLVQSLVDSLEDVHQTGEESVDGVETRVIEGRIDSEALEEALSFTEPGRDIDVTLWIGAEDDLPRRARVGGPLTPDEGDNIVRVIDLSRFNESFEINPP